MLLERLKRGVCLLGLLAGVSLPYCTGRSLGPESHKMDAQLRDRVKRNETGIAFSAQCVSPVDSAMKSQLQSAGITLHSVIGDIFTATGKADGIRKTARLDFVIRLESSRPVRRLKGKENDPP
ncbi:hypothetical protein JW906_11235 [bacterium]|nr:hypothetical protein [bacterium]